jgi:hypothetical protein
MQKKNTRFEMGYMGTEKLLCIKESSHVNKFYPYGVFF